MNAKLLSQVEKYIQDIILAHYKNPTINIFDEFVKMCQSYYDKPAHNFAELKVKNNTKLKGDIFEHFAYKYFLSCYPDITNVWLLKDLPDEYKQKLSLKKSDLGIDLIAQDKNGGFYAIQAKYRKKGYKLKTGIGWKQLSTFYALCNRTGPYKKHIIITNADYVRHVGHKTKSDQSICIGTLKSITLDNWLKIANLQGQKLDNNIGKIINATTSTADTIPEPISTVTKKKLIIRKKQHSDAIEIQNTVITATATAAATEAYSINDNIVIKKDESDPVTVVALGPKKPLIKKLIAAKTPPPVVSELDILRQRRLKYYESLHTNKID